MNRICCREAENFRNGLLENPLFDRNSRLRVDANNRLIRLSNIENQRDQMHDVIDTAVLHEQNINNLFVLMVVHFPQQANAQTMALMHV